VTAAALLSAETHEPFLVDQLEAQQRVHPGVEEKPHDAAVVSVVAPLPSWSFQLQQRVGLLQTLLSCATILTCRNKSEYFNVNSMIKNFSFFEYLLSILKTSSCFLTGL